MEKECHCGNSHEDEVSIEEIVDSNNVMIHALIELLIEKKIITEDEFHKKCDSMCEEPKEKEE